VTAGSTVSFEPTGGGTPTACPSGVCDFTGIGAWVVTATDGPATATAQVTTATGALASLTVAPTHSSVVAGSPDAMTVTGFDSHSNDIGTDLAATVTFAPTGGGTAQSCPDQICTFDTTGSYTVTATDGLITGSVPVTVTHATPGSLVLSPSAATTTAGDGDSVGVTEYDIFGNLIGADTAATVTYTPAAGGSSAACPGQVCTIDTAGYYKVAATDGAVSGTSAIAVNPGLLAALSISPESAVISEDTDVAYRITGADEYSNSLGDVTAGSTVSFEPTGGGTPTACPSGVCDFTGSGTFVVTAIDGPATTTAQVSSAAPQLSSAAPALPSITASLSSNSPPSSYGWYRSAVTVTFTCDGNGQPIAVCPGPLTIAGPGANLSASGTVKSSDGLTATVTVQNINIDMASPSLAVTGVRNGSTYDGAPPKLLCAGIDALSGIATCVVNTHTTAGATTYQNVTHYTAIATNKAGGTAEVSGSYAVDRVWFAGTKQSHGSWKLRAGRTYDLYCVTDGPRPAYLAPVAGGLVPGPVAGHFNKVGVVGSSAEWELPVTLSTTSQNSTHVNVGIQAGSRVEVLSVRLAN
jgi:hypothetical protein